MLLSFLFKNILYIGDNTMPIALIDVYEVRNISNQSFAVNIKSQPSSTIFPQSGPITLKSQAKVEAEINRFDIGQLRELQKKKLLQITGLKRSVDITSGGGSTGVS
jgi:hypothetical protein